ncbi:MAG: ATP-dependent zinc metalloprotease FtsH [Candidatus Omnitrophica bacterium]|nr:ATP-dependent zinc metalloprotease FtsH [Candidatus Omnitrophota bacterium]
MTHSSESNKEAPKTGRDSRPPGKKKEGIPGPFFLWVLVILALFYTLRIGSQGVEPGARQLSYGDFFGMLSSDSSSGRVTDAVRSGNQIKGALENGEKFYVTVPDQDPELEYLLKRKVDHYAIEPEKTLLIQFVYTLLGPILFVGLFWLLIYRGGGGAGRIMSFGKTRAKSDSPHLKTSFKDVAGVDEAKEELQEVVEYLKDPQRFQKLGGKIPKGVLLVGPPGTGKTLLAKAISGEAGVPFFSISGSDFVEMFVGVGASRVRDLFEQAKKAAKTSGKGAIIFIDEIDAVGRQRFAGIGGGHDEREQTLNALLVEMDGFGSHEAVILIAATNRPDVLDPALLRPGRFDRQVVVPRPDLVGREASLAVHASKVKLGPEARLQSIAKQTTNCSGADLANLVNEAALWAARLNKESVGMSELQESIERVMAGPQRRSRKISDKEKRIAAYHESGHALVSLFMPGADPLHKITIIPRGMAGGYTMFVPEEDRSYRSRKEFMGQMPVALGGRAAEEIVFEDITTGAQNDLQQVSQMARSMVCQYGMSEKLGHMTVGRDTSMIFLGRDIGDERNYSEETAKLIDSEIKKIVDIAYADAKAILVKHRKELDLLAEALIEKETIEGADARRMVGLPVPPASPTIS